QLGHECSELGSLVQIFACIPFLIRALSSHSLDNSLPVPAQLSARKRVCTYVVGGEEMKKTGLLLVLGLAVMVGTAAAPKANAGVVVGVSVGAPVYVHPARVYVAPAYVAPAPYVAFRAYPPVYRRVYVGPRVYSRWYGPRVVVRRSYGWRR